MTCCIRRPATFREGSYSMPAPPPAAWNISAGRATCTSVDPPSAIDFDRPAAGLEMATHGAGRPDHLLGLDFEAACGLVDAWSRGGDLVAVYESAAGRLRATAMWRADAPWCGPACGSQAWCREVVVSAQTPLLEATPRVVVVAEVVGEAATPVRVRDGGLVEVASEPTAAHGFFVRRPAGMAVLFLVHPLDARAVEATVGDDRVRIAAHLFPAVLEKGVLLRSRVIAAGGPVSDGIAIPAWAERLAAAFAASPPVLTT